MIDRDTLTTSYARRVENSKTQPLAYKEALARRIKVLAKSLRDAGDSRLWLRLPLGLHKLNVKTMQGWYGFAKREFNKALA